MELFEEDKAATGTYSVRVEKKLFKSGDRIGPSKRSAELQRNLPECLGRPKLDLPQQKNKHTRTKKDSCFLMLWAYRALLAPSSDKG